MRRAELRDGLRRLALVLAACALAIVASAFAIWLGTGGSFRARLAFVLTLCAALSMLLGVVAFLGTGGVGPQWAPGAGSRVAVPRRVARLRGHDERRQREWFAAGLLAFGAVLFACSTVVR